MIYTVSFNCEPTLRRNGDNMFSKTELEYLKAPEKFDAAYGRVLHHRINAKKAKARAETTALNCNTLSALTNCNTVTEFCNGQKAQNELGMLKGWWAETDSNHRPLARKANVLTKLDDRPTPNLK